jgi:hypothetical protein
MSPLPRELPGSAPARALLGAVLLRYAYELAAFSLLALPVLNATAASGIAHFPEPATQLFQDGGIWLLELLRNQQASLLASLGPGLWCLGLLAFGTLVPEWWLLELLARQRRAAAPAGAALRSLSLLGLGLGLLRALGWALALGLSLLLRSRLERALDERIPDLGLLAALGLGLVLQLGLSLLRDLTAASVVADRLRLLPALSRAWHQARQHGLRLAAPYATVRLLSLVALVGAEALAVALGGTDGTHPGLGFAAHQVGLLLRVALHAAWLWWLVRGLPAPQPAQAEAFL